MTVTDGDLTDWYISVDGEYPFTFQSPLRDAVGLNEAILFENAIISNDAISIESETIGGIVFFARYSDGCLADQFCRAFLTWDPERPIIEFTHTGFISGGGLSPDMPDEGDFLFREFARQPLVGTVVVAVAVPEPTTGLLAAMGLLGVTGLARKRTR